MLTADVIEMPSPIHGACPVCKRPCSDEDLSECNRCGDKMCRRCSWCSCDAAALDLLDRAVRRLLTPRWWRLADFLSARIESKS